MPTSPIERLPAARSAVTLTIDGAARQKAEEQALQSLATQVNLKGFRPGKAPASVVREQIKPDILLEETIRVIVSSALPALMQEHNLKPILPPKVELTATEPLTMKVVFVEHPEVKVKEKDLRVEKKEAKADQKDIDRVIQSVLAEDRTTKEVERAAQKGDQVTIDFHATDEAGTPIEGLKAEAYQAVIGEANLLPGFEDALAGLEKGGKKSFTLTLPENYQAEHLRKKPVTFHVSTAKIEEVQTPTLTDEYAKAKLRVGSAKEFTDKVTDSIKAQEEQFQRMSRERQLIEQITKATTVELAPELLDEELRMLISDLGERLQSQGTTMADWLKTQNKTPEKLTEEFKVQAADRLKLRFGISKLIDEKAVTLTPEELQQAVENFLGSVPDEQQTSARAALVPGTEQYRELEWRTKVEKLLNQLLA